MVQRNIFRIKFYLTADTPDELIIKQIENSTKFKKEYDYSDFKKIGSKWWTFFYDDATERIPAMRQEKQTEQAPQKKVSKKVSKKKGR